MFLRRTYFIAHFFISYHEDHVIECDFKRKVLILSIANESNKAKMSPSSTSSSFISNPFPLSLPLPYPLTLLHSGKQIDHPPLLKNDHSDTIDCLITNCWRLWCPPPHGLPHPLSQKALVDLQPNTIQLGQDPPPFPPPLPSSVPASHWPLVWMLVVAAASGSGSAEVAACEWEGGAGSAWSLISEFLQTFSAPH